MDEAINKILQIDKMIFEIRGHRVMIDFDLASLYGIETKRLKEQVRRNIERFPDDFMFELTLEERKKLKILGSGNRQLPFAFTENGVAMLSSVLSSSRAIQINIAIMRTFTKLRSFLSMESSLAEHVDKLEKDSTSLFKIVFKRLDSIETNISPVLPDKRRKIGIKNSKLQS